MKQEDKAAAWMKALRRDMWELKHIVTDRRGAGRKYVKKLTNRARRRLGKLLGRE